MNFTEKEAREKQGEFVTVLDESFCTSTGNKVKKRARGHVVSPHELDTGEPQTNQKVWAVNVRLNPAYAPEPDDDLIEHIEKDHYERSLDDGDFIKNR